MIGRFALACLDMAGTTVRDDGAVEAAFTTALAAVGHRRGAARFEEAEVVVRETMGWSKADVFATLLEPARGSGGHRRLRRRLRGDRRGRRRQRDPRRRSGSCATCAPAGVKVCLTTGFAPSTRDALLDALGWRAEIDLALSPADVGRGRPAPDLILGAMARLGVERPGRGGGGGRHGQRPRGGARRRRRGGGRRPERRPRRGHAGRRLPDGGHRRRDGLLAVLGRR